jgi:hypothetical protein
MANESESKINDDTKEELTPEERIAWLRERVRHRFAHYLVYCIGTQNKTTHSHSHSPYCLFDFDCKGSIGGNVRGEKGDGDKTC